MKVAIQHGLSLDREVTRMFAKKGHDVRNLLGFQSFDINPNDYDLLVFTGGADVSPWLYGEENTASRCHPQRDQCDYVAFRRFSDCDIPMAGICRGGQFLNVVHGGKMIQDVPGFVGLVRMRDVTNKESIEVQVGHHQGMVCGKDGVVVAEGVSLDNTVGYDIRYRGSSIFCFQPHPEWGHEATEGYFFSVIDEVKGK